MILSILKCDDCGKTTSIEDHEHEPKTGGMLRDIYRSKGWLHTGSPVCDYCAQCLELARSGRAHTSEDELLRIIESEEFKGAGFTLYGLCALGVMAYPKRRLSAYKHTVRGKSHKWSVRFCASNHFTPNAPERLKFVLKHYKKNQNIGHALQALFEKFGVIDSWDEDEIVLAGGER